MDSSSVGTAAVRPRALLGVRKSIAAPSARQRRKPAKLPTHHRDLLWLQAKAAGREGHPHRHIFIKILKIAPAVALPDQLLQRQMRSGFSKEPGSGH